jgi:type I restriction enzyme S subunit
LSNTRDISLPVGWDRAPISEVAEINPKFDKSGLDDALEVSFVPMPAVEAETGVIDVGATRPFGEVKKGYTGFLEGDVLFAKITPCMENGKMAVVPSLKNNVGFGSTEFHVLRPYPGVSPEYLYYFVSAKLFRYDAEHNMTGAVGQKRVPVTYLSGQQIPLAPSKEQHRIVAKIEALFSELDKGIEALKTARKQLKVYRQAVLKHAFEGKLTAQWREENKDAAHGRANVAGGQEPGATKLESPEQLLARIQQEREARYQQQLQDWQAAVKTWEKNGKEGKKPGKPKNLGDVSLPTAEEVSLLPPIPRGWVWIYLDSLVSGIDQGWSPKCDNTPAADGEWGVIKTTAIQHGEFLGYENKALPSGLVPRKQHELNVGDILITRAGPRIRVGVCCLVRKVRGKLMNCDKVYRIRSIETICLPDYLEAVLNSPRILDEIESIKSGINDSGVNLNQGAFLRLAIPFCPIDEQAATILKLEQTLSVLNKQDETIEVALEQSETLRQSILKKAFSGQLVPQDPNDEPARVLLERIREKQTALVKPGKDKTMRRPV